MAIAQVDVMRWPLRRERRHLVAIRQQEIVRTNDRTGIARNRHAQRAGLIGLRLDATENLCAALARNVQKPTRKRHRIDLRGALRAQRRLSNEPLGGELMAGEPMRWQPSTLPERALFFEQDRIKRIARQVERIARRQIARQPQRCAQIANGADRSARALIDARRSVEAAALLKLQHRRVDFPLQQRSRRRRRTLLRLVPID